MKWCLVDSLLDCVRLKFFFFIFLIKAMITVIDKGIFPAPCNSVTGNHIKETFHWQEKNLFGWYIWCFALICLFFFKQNSLFHWITIHPFISPSLFFYFFNFLAFLKKFPLASLSTHSCYFVLPIMLSLI